MVTYLLSNRQRKDLLVRGAPLLLALPSPPEDVRDPLDWARSVLPAELRQCVVSAEEEEVRASVTQGRDGQGGLASLIGQIVPPDIRASWTIGVACVVARLEHGRPRGSPVGPQWPGDVTWPGRLPRSAGLPPASEQRAVRAVPAVPVTDARGQSWITGPDFSEPLP